MFTFLIKTIDKSNFPIYNKNRKRQDLKRLCQMCIMKITHHFSEWALFFMVIINTIRVIKYIIM